MVALEMDILGFYPGSALCHFVRWDRFPKPLPTSPVKKMKRVIVTITGDFARIE